MTEYLTGFTIAIGLIIAIGAQNAWVLGMSVRRLYPWSIAIVCFSVDALLMGVGVLAFKTIQQALPSIVPWLTWVGILMLVWLSWQSLRRAVRGKQVLTASELDHDITRKKAVMTALGISLLNPHVYLDTVVLIGSIASTSAHPWQFWSGSASASVIWFSLLAAIGRPLRQWLSSPWRWRVFDGAMAGVIAWVAVNLFLSLP